MPYSSTPPRVLIITPDLRPDPPLLSESGTLALLAFVDHALWRHINHDDPAANIFGMPCPDESVLREVSELSLEDWNRSIVELIDGNYYRTYKAATGPMITDVRVPERLRGAARHDADHHIMEYRYRMSKSMRSIFESDLYAGRLVFDGANLFEVDSDEDDADA